VVARNMESAHRTSLGKRARWPPRKEDVPTLADFISERFETLGEASTDS